MHKISYKSARNNCKLTDFEQTKALVLNNSIKSVPELSKKKSSSSDSMLSSFF